GKPPCVGRGEYKPICQGPSGAGNGRSVHCPSLPGQSVPGSFAIIFMEEGPGACPGIGRRSQGMITPCKGVPGAGSAQEAPWQGISLTGTVGCWSDGETAALAVRGSGSGTGGIPGVGAGPTSQSPQSGSPFVGPVPAGLL